MLLIIVRGNLKRKYTETSSLHDNGAYSVYLDHCWDWYCCLNLKVMLIG